MAVEHLLVHIRGEALSLSSELKKAASEAEHSGNKIHSSFAKIGKIAAAAGGAVVAGAVAIGVEAVHMADDFEKSHARLQVALQNSHISWQSQAKAIKAADDAGVRFGYNKGQVEAALAIAIRGTGNAAKGFRILSIAQDLSAATGKDLESSVLAVTRASEGQLRPLKMLGIDLPIAAAGALKVQKAQDALAKALENLAHVQEVVRLKHLSHMAALALLGPATDKVKTAQENLNTVQHAGTNILDALQQRLKGSASAASDTFAGKVAALKAQATNLGIELGLKLIPIIEKLVSWFVTKVVPAVQSTVNWFGRHKDIALSLAGGITGVVVPAIALMTAAWIKQTAAMIAANLEIFLVIGAIAAVSAGAVYAYQHFGWFRSAVDNTAFALKQLAAAGSWLVGQLQSAFNSVADAWNNTIGRLPGMPTMGRWGGGGGGGGAPAPNPHRYDVPIPNPTAYAHRYDVPAPIHNAPYVRGRAAGGPVMPYTTYTVGERGPETLVMGAGGGHIVPNGGGGTTVIVNIHGPSFGANSQYHAATAEAVVNQLVQHQQRRGTHWQFVQGTGPG